MEHREAQTRTVAIALDLLEAQCAQLAALLASPTRGDAVPVVSDIPSATADVARAHIAGLRAEIAALGAELELQTTPRSALQTARALVTTSRSLLEEVLPERLGRDEAMDPSLAEPLTKALTLMLERLDVLHRQLITARST